LTSGNLALGTIYMMISGLVFIISNSLINIGVAHLLSPELYGIFGIVMSFNYINWVLINSASLASARFIAGSNKLFYSIFKAALKLQAIQAVFFSLLYILGSGIIANLLNDPSLRNYIIAVGIMLIPNAFLTLYLDGFYGGLCKFKQRAYLNIFFSVGKVIFSGIFIYFGFKIFGLLLGYFLAIILALLIGIYKLKVKSNYAQSCSTETFESKKIFYFALPIAIATLAFTLIKNSPIIFIKFFLQDNLQASFFNAANTLAGIPYAIFTALAFTLLPVISKSALENNFPAIRNYILKSFRYLFIFLMPIIALMIPTSRELITLFYPPLYLDAAPVLNILLINVSVIIVYTSFRSIIIGLGRPMAETIISLTSFAILCILSALMIPKGGIIGAAWASLISSTTAFILGSIYIFKQHAAFINLKSVLKIFFCSAVIYHIIAAWHHSGLFLIINYLILLSLYALLLYLFGELTAEDLNLVKAIYQKMFKNAVLHK